jgi:hypothetical protein
MPENIEALSGSERLKALRQIRVALCHQEHPTLRACGLTEGVAAAVASGGLIELYRVEDEGSYLDMYRVDKISEAGFGILAIGEVAESPPLRIAVEPRHESAWSWIRRALVSGLWDVVKIALGVPVGILVGYFLWRHHWK